MPQTPLTSRRTGDQLELRRGDAAPRLVELTRLSEVWLVRVGDGFSGPNEFILILVDPDSATPLPLEHHSVWTDLLADMKRLASQGAAFQAEADRLPRTWITNRFSPFSRASVPPIAHPRAELDTARSNWSVQPWAVIPETMP